MPRYLYAVSARADVLETWAVESEKPLTAEEFMEMFHEGDAGKLFFVSDEVDGNEEERIFKECLGEEAPTEDALGELLRVAKAAAEALRGEVPDSWSIHGELADAIAKAERR